MASTHRENTWFRENQAVGNCSAVDQAPQSQPLARDEETALPDPDRRELLWLGKRCCQA